MAKRLTKLEKHLLLLSGNKLEEDKIDISKDIRKIKMPDLDSINKAMSICINKNIKVYPVLNQLGYIAMIEISQNDVKQRGSYEYRMFDKRQKESLEINLAKVYYLLSINKLDGIQF